MYTKHFHQRLFERCGIVLSAEEKQAVGEAVLLFMAQEPPQTSPFELEVVLHHRGETFVVVFNPVTHTLITAYRRSRRRKAIPRPAFKYNNRANFNSGRKATKPVPIHRLLQDLETA